MTDEFAWKTKTYRQKIALAWLYEIEYSQVNYIISKYSKRELAIITIFKDWSDSHAPTNDEVIESIQSKLNCDYAKAMDFFTNSKEGYTKGLKFAYDRRKETLRKIIGGKNNDDIL